LQILDFQRDIEKGVQAISVTVDEPSLVCAHHWRIDPPSGPWSLGICNKCGEYDAFKNSIDVGGWAGAAPSNYASTKIINREVSKTEFLKQCIPPRLLHDGSYTEAFKLKMVSLAASGTRSYVRKKFNIPETTLRGWIKTYQKKETK